MRTETSYMTGCQHLQPLQCKGRRVQKMASAMENGRERSDLQIVFSNCKAEVRITDSNNTTFHSNRQRAREDKSLFKRIQPNRQTDVLLQWGRTVGRTPYICMQNTGTPKKLHVTTYNYQNWDLALPKQRTRYLNAYAQYVKFIDFSEI